MAEEKKEKKKPGIVKRIFKWIGLGLLAILLIAGLIFQAPWKVTTLLLILLLASTALPKPARKWFYLLVGAVVIVLIVWVFLPDRGEWKPYTFDEELATLEAKRAIPDSENAALIYEELFANYDGYIFVPPKLKIEEAKDVNIVEYMNLAEEAQPEDTFFPEFWNDELDDLTLSKAWSSKGHPKVAEWLQDKHGCTIIDLLRACRKDTCRFPIRIDPGGLEQMNRNSAMRRWAYLLLRAANNDLGEDRIDQALEKQIAVLQMAKHQCQQPTMIDMLVGIAIEALAIKQFNTFVVDGDATEERLSVIESALADIKHDWGSDLLRILEGEKLMAKNFWGHLYEINPEGKVRFSRDPTAPIRAQFTEEIPLPTYWQKKLTRAGAILGWFFLPSTPQKAAKIIDESYEKYYAMAKPDFDWKKEPKEFSPKLRLNYRYLTKHMVGILEPAYYRIHDIYLRVTSDQRGSRIIIALRRYKNKNNSWPQTLDEIKSFAPAEIFIDPQNDGAFVYKLTEENFTLYSKGKNNIDEGGKRDKWNEEKTGADDWLIWPQKSRKTKEKKTDAEQQ